MGKIGQIILPASNCLSKCCRMLRSVEMICGVLCAAITSSYLTCVLPLGQELLRRQKYVDAGNMVTLRKGTVVIFLAHDRTCNNEHLGQMPISSISC